jgi:hypothetical protein
VIRHGPFLLFGPATIVREITSASSGAEAQDVVIGIAVGLLLLVGYYPVWRWLAKRYPKAATSWQPELLDEPIASTQMHPRNQRATFAG